MVALKYWVAKDATEHGQIISESDLTNDAIFERLEEDAQFRSVATALVQRYGYLLPKLNPESDVAKEHELLVQERTKWLAQNQEEELAEARRRRERNLQNAKCCNPRLKLRNDRDNSAGIRNRRVHARLRICPGEEWNPLNPPARNSFGYPQTMQADMESPDFPFPLADSPRSRQSSDSFGLDGTPRELSVGETTSGGRNQLSTWLLEGDAENRNAMGGAISSKPPRSDGLNGVVPEASPVTEPPDAPVTPRLQADLVRTANPYKDIPSLYDMYMQAIPQPDKPQRFGMEVFLMEHATQS